MLTLASDFGTPYPAAMRAAILRRTDARIVDVAHDFPRQDVRTAAFWLCEVLPYFPPAIHCVVIDPGVGSDRAAITVRAGEHVLVGPDNGLLLPAARALESSPAPTAGAGLRGLDPVDDRQTDGAEGAAIECFEIVVEDPESATFHGRDVFAPAAAAIHETGVERVDDCPFLEPTDDYVDLSFPEPKLQADAATGEVLVVDGFGNAVTNVPGEWLTERCSLRGRNETVQVEGTAVPAADHYEAVSAGQRLVTVGSHGNVELAVNRGQGSEAFGVAVGDAVELRVD